MKRFLIPLTALALAGCATKQEPQIVYRDVKVMVQVPCKVTLPPEPVLAGDYVPLDAPLYDLVRAIMQERADRQAAKIEDRAAAKSCS